MHNFAYLNSYAVIGVPARLDEIFYVASLFERKLRAVRSNKAADEVVSVKKNWSGTVGIGTLSGLYLFDTLSSALTAFQWEELLALVRGGSKGSGAGYRMYDFDFYDDGVVFCTHEGNCYYFEPKGGTARKVADERKLPCDFAEIDVVSVDGDRLYVGSRGSGGCVAIYDINSGRTVYDHEFDEWLFEEMMVKNGLLVFADEHGNVKVYDSSFRPRFEIDVDPSEVRGAITLNDDATFLVVVDSPRDDDTNVVATVKVYNARTGKEVTKTVIACDDLLARPWACRHHYPIIGVDFADPNASTIAVSLTWFSRSALSFFAVEDATSSNSAGHAGEDETFTHHAVRRHPTDLSLGK